MAATPGKRPDSGTSHIRWTRGGIISFAVTTLAVGALLILLWSRLLAAQHVVATLGPSPLVGKPGPEFAITHYPPSAGPATAATRLDLARLKGRPVVVNFWGSWCVPCQDEAPIFEAAWQKYQAAGVVFIGVDERDTPAAARAFLRQYGTTYATGPDDQTGSIAISYGVTGTPETVFISRSGTVLRHEGGPVDDRTLELGIENLLKSPSP